MACDVAADEPPTIPTVQELHAPDKLPVIPSVQELRAPDKPHAVCTVQELRAGDASSAIGRAPDLCADDAGLAAHKRVRPSQAHAMSFFLVCMRSSTLVPLCSTQHHESNYRMCRLAGEIFV